MGGLLVDVDDDDGVSCEGNGHGGYPFLIKKES